MNIGEIAKLAGVSNAAVSRYFNNGYISEEKREAIRRVVEETGYRPSIQAQTLRTRRTKMIGVILPKIDSASVGSMVAGILSVLNEHGYQLLLADTQNNPERELEYLKVFNEKQVDGVIFIATVFTSGHRQALRQMKQPLVILGQCLPGYHCVFYDDYNSVYDMTSRILEKGRTRMGYISVLHQDKAAGLDRYRGYCDAVRDHGLEQLAEQYVISDFTMQGGYQKAGELMERFPDLNAVICATDAIAVGALRRLRELEISVPEQVMLTGHGDAEITRVTTPSLTTVHYPYEDSGAMAAKMLLEILDKKELAVKEMKMGYSIVEHQSSRE